MLEAARRSPALAVGAFMVLAWIVSAAAAPFLAPAAPTAMSLGSLNLPPSWSHWFGTDQYGRDVLSRVLYGGRYVLLVAPAATALGLAVGAAIGLTAAYFGRWVDEVIMRLLDAVMAFPIVVLALLALTTLGPSIWNVILVIGLVFAPLIARTARAAALVEVRREYVQAARLRGESTLYILAVEVLPNIRGPLIVEGTIRVGYAVFTSATLGFLGLGIQPPAPDWGLMVSENRALMTTAPWTVLFPALAIGFVVIGFSLTADGLRELEEA
ncbi:MAG: ABC transporter permease [Ectothiorhodospiraceae bacterium]